MSTPEEIIVSFATTADAFEPVVGAPNENNFERIHSTFVDLLQSFRYQGRQNSLSDLIKLEAKHRAWLSHDFNRLETADRDDYYPNITSNLDIGKRRRRKAVFEAKKVRSLLVSTIDHSARLFILFIVAETWVSKLEDADTYFNCVSTKALL